VTGSGNLGTSGPATTPETAPPIGAETSLTGLLATIVRSARDVGLHVLEVMALESRLAGVALAGIVGVGVGIVVTLISAWGLLLAAGVSWMVDAGLAVGAALLVAAAANLVIAVLLAALVVPWLARRMMFSATRRVIGKMGSHS
jgi:hypothetical protein